jgi:hypothetical protein
MSASFCESIASVRQVHRRPLGGARIHSSFGGHRWDDAKAGFLLRDQAEGGPIEIAMTAFNSSNHAVAYDPD